MNVPNDLLYATSHEWLRLEAAQATVGITDHAQHELTDVVYVELPSVGSHFEAGAPICVVESVKAASDIYSPAAGTVEAVNEALIGDPALVNTDPYGSGWIFKLRLDSTDSLSSLKTPAEYTEQLGQL
ncbi:MAG: glycine cleavage system protein GcvH [Verrucomicrobia bacterium]|nr:glycine cleavage system protein GcvH [Verrucomicrobiota bacterium]